MYYLYLPSATSAVMMVSLVRQRWPFQSDVHKRRRYRAEDCVEIRLYGRDEAVTQRWPDILLIRAGRRYRTLLKSQLDTIY